MNICRNNRLCGSNDEDYQRQEGGDIEQPQLQPDGRRERVDTIGPIGHRQEVNDLYDRNILEFEDGRVKFVDPYMHKNSCSDDFLESVKQTVPLNKCKQVVRSAYFDQNMPFAAIVVELKNDDLRKYYGGNFLLQAYRANTGKLVWQRVLMQNLRVFNSARQDNSFIYVPGPEDEPVKDKAFIYIVSLGKDPNDITERKIEDWTGLCRTNKPEEWKQISCMIDKKNVLYVSDHNQLHAVLMTTLLENYSGRVLTVGQDTCQGVTRLDGDMLRQNGTSFRLLCMFDTKASFTRKPNLDENADDSVIAIFCNKGRADYCNIVTKQEGSELKFQFIQDKELINRNQLAESADTPDNIIKKIKHVQLRNGKQVTVAVRGTGVADLYWNMKLIHSSEECKGSVRYTYLTDTVHLNFDQIVMRRYAKAEDFREGMEAMDIPEHLVVIPLDKEQLTTFNDAIKQPNLTEDKTLQLKCMKFKDAYKPYNDFLFSDNMMILGHGNILSSYEVSNKQFVSHKELVANGSQDLTNEVQSIFRYKRDAGAETKGIGVLLKNGSIKQCRVEAGQTSIVQDFNARIDGVINSYALDKHHTRALFAISTNGNDSHFSVFMNGKVYTCENVIVTAKSQIVPHFSSADNTQFIILNEALSELTVWQLKEKEETNDVVSEMITKFLPNELFNEKRLSIFHSALVTEKNEALILFDSEHMYIFQLMKKQEVFVADSVMMKKKEVALESVMMEKKEGALESVLIQLLLKIQQNMCGESNQADHDEDDLEDTTIADFNLGTLIIHENMNVQNLRVVQNRHIYSLYNRVCSRQKNSRVTNPMQMTRYAMLNSGNGLGYMDLKNILEDIKSTPNLIPVTNAIVGLNNQIRFSDACQTIIFMQGVDSGVQILPVLHQNLLPLQGQKPKKEDYIFTAESCDKFIGLGYDNRLDKWDKQTGIKLSSIETVRDLDGNTVSKTQEFRISQQISSNFNEQNKSWEVFRSNSEEQCGEIGLYRKHLFSYTLIYKKAQEAQVPGKIYPAERTESSHKLQISALDNIPKTYHEHLAMGLDANDNIEVKVRFNFPRLGKGDQYLFLSEAFDKLLQLHEEEAILYELFTLAGTDKKDVKFVRRLSNLPIGLGKGNAYQVYCLFSPDFTMHFDVDPTDQTLIVRSTGEDEETIYKIPQTLITYNKLNADAILQQTKFMCWDTNQQISVVDINGDPFMWHVIDIGDVNYVPGQLEEGQSGEGKREASIVVSATIPYMDIEPYLDSILSNQDERVESGTLNFFKAKLIFARSDTLGRLMRMHQDLKKLWYVDDLKKTIDYHLDVEKDQVVETGQQKELSEEEKEERKQLRLSELENKHVKTYSKIFTMDCVTDKNKFLIETPFTFIHWRMTEMLQILSQLPQHNAHRIAESRNLAQEVAQAISLNVYPEVETVLHKIAGSHEVTKFFCEKVQGVKPDPFGYQFFPAPYEDPWPMPFIDNLEGNCPLEQSLRKQKETDQLSKKPCTFNTQTAEFLLHTLLPNMPLDHHGRCISDILPDCIKERIRYVDSYMDSRFFQSSQVRMINRTDGKAIKGGEDHRIEVCYLNDDSNVIRIKIFDEGNDSGVVGVFILDLPRIHNPNDPIAKRFIEALSKDKDLAIFRSNAVKAVTEYQWEPCYEYILWWQLVPYSFFMAVYLVNVFYILDIVEDHRPPQSNEPFPGWLLCIQIFFNGTLILFSCWFLFKEHVQFHKMEGEAKTFVERLREYWTDFWNYPDVVPPICIIIIIGVDTFSTNEADHPGLAKFRFTMQAIACFFMWLKIFYFLRIFRQTGFFVNMLLQVTVYIATFLLLYCLILSAFSCCFFIMNHGGKGDYIKYLKEQYLLGLGEFETGWDETRVPYTAEAFFFVATMVSLVVMMNILIAQVGKAYEEVMEKKEQANDSERSQLIYQVISLVSWKKKQAMCLPNQFLIKASKNSQNDANATTDA